MLIKILKKCILISIFLHNSSFASPLLFELNPLLMINQGMGLSAEYGIKIPFSVGVDFQANFQTPYDQNQVKSTRTIYAIGPKFRYYFFTDDIAGPFVGIKILYLYSQSQIYDKDTSALSTVNNVAPTVQAGYRFLAKNGFTVSAFVGAGFKFVNDRWQDSQIPVSKVGNTDWSAAEAKLNQNVSRFEPDYGVTIGYLF
jgi:hypothetical protein